MVMEISMPKMQFALIACSFLVIFGAPEIAHAQAIRVGGLTCDSSPRVGLIFGSRQKLRCVFRSSDPARHLVYSAVPWRDLT